MDKRAYWLWLTMVFGPADSRIWQLGAKMSGAEDFCSAIRQGRISGLSAGEQKRAASVSLERAEEVIAHCSESGIQVLSYECGDYPSELKEISNPPAVLFVKGDIGQLKNKFVVCIAGSRSPSDYSRKVTSMLARTLGEKDCVIASGLSAGTDLLAYQIALDSGIPALGIYGLAIDRFGQDESILLPEDCLVISETHSELGFPRPGFSGRNRLITALCSAVVFVEGSLKSRGLELCRSCIQQGRLLYVVPPHDISDPRYMGQSWLLRQGCQPVFSASDIIFEFSRMGVDRLAYSVGSGEYTEMEDYSFFKGEVPEHKKGKSSSSGGKKAAPAKVPKFETRDADLSGLSEKEKEILQLLKKGTMLADELSSRIGEDIAETLSMLTMLELEGFVQSLPGKRFGLQ